MTSGIHSRVAWALGLVQAALLLGCGPDRPAQPAAGPPAVPALDGATVSPWQGMFAGVDYASVQARSPRPMQIHVLRIDLAEPGVDFLVTPSNGEAPGETDSMTTGTFLKRHACQAAVNASPYSPVVREEGKALDVDGLSVSRGQAYSAASRQFAAILLTRDRKVRIAAPPVDAADAWNAVGGFGVLLKGGRNVAGPDSKLHPRTAAGVSADGRFLYLLAIDGRQAGYSEGATVGETADWLARFGAHEALNLDGGGSTAMVVADGRGGVRVLNRPIDRGIPGTQRPVANHLGVLARPLTAPRR